MKENKYYHRQLTSLCIFVIVNEKNFIGINNYFKKKELEFYHR